MGRVVYKNLRYCCKLSDKDSGTSSKMNFKKDRATRSFLLHINKWCDMLTICFNFYRKRKKWYIWILLRKLHFVTIFENISILLKNRLLEMQARYTRLELKQSDILQRHEKMLRIFSERTLMKLSLLVEELKAIIWQSLEQFLDFEIILKINRKYHTLLSEH